MTKPRAVRRGRRVLVALAVVLAVPLVYVGVQAVARSAPLAGTTQLIAHRGGPVYAPENTLAAFRGAIAQGATWLEFDVQMSRDGALVVIHDETVDRTTDGSGAVRDLDLAQLQALDAGGGERVPTFLDVVQLARDHGLGILPETKSPGLYPGIEERLLEELRAADYLHAAVIQSFDAGSLERLRRLAPDARLCALYGLWRFDVRDPAGAAEVVCPMAEMVLLRPDLIRQAHREGRQVFVWFGMFENPFLFRAMRFFGVDGVMSDDPALLRTTLTGR